MDADKTDQVLVGVRTVQSTNCWVAVGSAGHTTARLTRLGETGAFSGGLKRDKQRAYGYSSGAGGGVSENRMQGQLAILQDLQVADPALFALHFQFDVMLPVRQANG
jgi:hypothetical protein